MNMEAKIAGDLAILVIEDTRTLGLALSRRIRQEFECRVELVERCREAETFLQREPAPFLAISDLNLPDAPRGEVVDLLVRHHVPVVVFTSSIDEATRRMFLDKGVVDYFFKGPRGIDLILQAIRRLLRNRQTTVLVVDDGITMRHRLQSLLELSLFRVLQARHGVEALAVLDEHPEVRLVITDFHMPEMDGLQLTEALRERHPPSDLAIIGLSAVEGERLATQFIKAGANDFLHKPFEMEEFSCRVVQNLDMLDQIRSLRELNQLKNRFLGIAAHDLRSPIHAIRGFSDLVLDGSCGPVTDQQREFLDIVFQSSNQMLALVNDLLDVSAIESGSLQIVPEPDCLIDLVRERIRLHQMAAEKKGIQIESVAEPLPAFPFDRERIAQVLDNLIGNALKFSPDGTKVVIRVSQENGMATVSVRDQGPGFSKEDLGRMFQMFQKLSARPTGGEKSIGLGLAIVKKLVLAHRGEVAVKSPPGGGADFIFTLPLSPT